MLPENGWNARARQTLERWTTRWNALPGNLRGSAWLVIASFIFATMAALIKEVGQRLPVVEILFWRQLFVIVVVSPAIVKGFPAVFRTERLKLHMARVGFSAIAMTTGFTAIVHMPLAEATAISFARTLFTTLLAIFILHEIVGWRRWSATIVGFIGVVIVVQPTAEGLDIYALLALISAFFVAGIMIVLRMLSQTERPVTIMTYQAVFLTIILAPFAAWVWVTPTWWDIGLLALIGLIMSAGQWSNIQAYRAGEASAIAPFEYGRLLFATLLGFWIFDEIPTIYTALGAVVIMGSTIYTAHRNAIKKAPPLKPEDDAA